MKYAGKDELKNGVGIGAIVSLCIDYCVHSHASALLGIVFAKKGKIQVVSECVASMVSLLMTVKRISIGYQSTSTPLLPSQTKLLLFHLNSRWYASLF